MGGGGDTKGLPAASSLAESQSLSAPEGPAGGHSNLRNSPAKAASSLMSGHLLI